MEFGYMLIYVSDVEKTVSFYKKVFDLNLLFMHESKEYAELDTGSTKLAFVSERLGVMNCGEFRKNNIGELPPGFEISFVSDNVDEAYKTACENGAVSVQEPVQKPWGQRVAHVKDFNGILVEICSPLPV